MSANRTLDRQRDPEEDRRRALPAAIGLISAVPTAVLLVLFNLVPLAGVLWWGWQLHSILVLYWLESGVIGLLNIPRIALARRPSSAGTDLPVRRGADRAMAHASKVILIPFFVFHYGLFWLVHGVFVVLLPLFAGLASGFAQDIDTGGQGRSGTAGGEAPGFGAGVDFGLDLGDVLVGAVGIALFHLVSFVYWELFRREYERVSPEAQMFAPYRRVVVLHVTIIGGAFLVGLTGRPLAALAILVVLKTVLDVAAHVGEHRVSATPG